MREWRLFDKRVHVPLMQPASHGRRTIRCNPNQLVSPIWSKDIQNRYHKISLVFASVSLSNK